MWSHLEQASPYPPVFPEKGKKLIAFLVFYCIVFELHEEKECVYFVLPSLCFKFDLQGWLRLRT